MQLQNVPNDQVMAIFARSPKTRIFYKSAKGGPREIFQKAPNSKCQRGINEQLPKKSGAHVLSSKKTNSDNLGGEWQQLPLPACTSKG